MLAAVVNQILLHYYLRNRMRKIVCKKELTIITYRLMSKSKIAATSN